MATSLKLTLVNDLTPSGPRSTYTITDGVNISTALFAYNVSDFNYSHICNPNELNIYGAYEGDDPPIGYVPSFYRKSVTAIIYESVDEATNENPLIGVRVDEIVRQVESLNTDFIGTFVSDIIHPVP